MASAELIRFKRAREENEERKFAPGRVVFRQLRCEPSRLLLSAGLRHESVGQVRKLEAQRGIGFEFYIARAAH